MGISKKQIEEEAQQYVKSKTPSKFTKKTPNLDKQLLSTNLRDPQHLEVIFKRYQEAGLFSGKHIPTKFKNAEHFRSVVDAIFKKRIKKDKSKIDAFIDKNAKKRHIESIKRGILNQIIQGEAKRNFTAQGVDWANDPVLVEKINNLKYKGLPLKAGSKGIKYNARQFNDKVLDTVIEWANESGMFPKDAGKNWAKNARAEWKKWGETNQALKAKYGIDFDIGHFIPSALGGPNVGANAASELTWNRLNELGAFIPGNRPKGKKPGLYTSQIANELHIPESYLQDFLNKQLGVTGQGVSPIEQAVYPSAGDMQRVANKSTLDEQIKAADKLAATTRSKTDAAAQLIVEVENLKKQGIIPSETTVIGDGSKKPQIKSFNDLKKFSDATKAGDFEWDIIDGERRLRRRQFIANKTQTILKNPQLKKVINATDEFIKVIPTPVKKVAGKYTYIGLLDDLAVIAAPFDATEKTDAQKKLERLQFARGVTGVGGVFLPPVAAMSAMLWTAEELIKHREKREENRDWYLEAFTNPTSGLGSEVITNKEGEAVDIKNPEWGQGRVINKRGRRVM